MAERGGPGRIRAWCGGGTPAGRGGWIDHAGGGVLVVSATNPTVIDAALRQVPDYAHMRVNRVARTLKSLQLAEALIMASEGTVRREQNGEGTPTISYDVIASVDEVNNTVLVTGPQAAKYSSGGLEQAHGFGSGTVTLSTARHVLVQPNQGGLVGLPHRSRLRRHPLRQGSPASPAAPSA